MVETLGLSAAFTPRGKVSVAACFTVVENAGYDGECDVRTCFSTSDAAWRWAARHYTVDELDELHVDVRLDGPAGGTYEY